MPRTAHRPRGRTVLTLGALAAVAALPLATAGAAPLTPALAVDAGAEVAAGVEVAAVAADGEYTQRFLELYDKVHDPANGYFSPQGIPYHSVETLMVEAPDYGHETTSEAYSFWLWLETSYGQVTGDWEPFNHAWDTLEAYMIPTTENQPTNGAYDPASPATYAPEFNHPSQYPSQLDGTVPVGSDPIGAELESTYGTSEIYGMHWLADVDNVYGYGAAPGSSELLGPDHEGTSYINTFQRGPQESVWETVPQPSIDDFSYGGENGYLDLFTGDASYAQQWKYTNAPDADARAVEAAYWANKFATEQGQPEAVADTVGKASKMGDYLRYALFDKYFKTPGCESTSCAAGSGRDSAHYLLSWYYAWGGALDTSSPWAWRIGSSHAHFGYQNPMAAWALANDPALVPDSPTAAGDWETSMDRQIELFQWLQSPEGGIAGGSTNSWDGHYADRPDDVATFYGMGYQEAPVYHDPPSNSWMGMQGWGVERIAQLYEETGDERAEAILDKWAPWVMDHITISADSWEIPSNLAWSGQPDDWDPDNPGDNAGLSVEVTAYGQDVGVAGALARSLMYYAAGGTGATHDEAQQVAHDLLDAIWTQNSDPVGVATTETRTDYARFDDVLTTTDGDGVYVPQGWSGTMPNGDVVEPGVSFLDMRSFYLDDPQWSKVQDHLDGGPAPEFTYHRFWAQTAVATALADYDRLFGEDDVPSDDTQAPTVPAGLEVTATTDATASLAWEASTDDTRVNGYTVRRDGEVVGTTGGTVTTFTDDGLDAGSSYEYTVSARDAAGNVSQESAPVTATTQEAAPVEGCTAEYATVGSWNGGYQGQVTVTAGPDGLSGWTVTWDAAPGTVTQAWGGVVTSQGSVVEATNESWNGTLAPGASATVGFIGSGAPPSDPAPTCG
ncbi:cellulose binding domain-containing protein [Isoptericola sp. NEAU-Y5]|uniref:Cellulose binding domain-containing protein n=1 Tax=Isoptericola luteus TaxID=2879484 RepID=A0ABS7ZHN6_9MICO|nr:glycoside hydrolase family 48 protein [Isoptericola sp. NEAU-Y5]MCA5893344.1 cellulose binding domain-containing protein [Isoptericola sp. NEAU-Y5]